VQEDVIRSVLNRRDRLACVATPSFGQNLESLNAFGGSGGDYCVVLAGNISARVQCQGRTHAGADIDTHG